MPKTIQQEAFLFSHEITKRAPHVADRLMELMIIDPKDLLAVATLNECVSLLLSHTDLLETFGRIFLPDNAALEVWTNSKGESHCMFVQGDTLIRLRRLVCSSISARHATVHAAAPAKNMREHPPATATESASRQSRTVLLEEDDGGKKLPALPSIPSKRKSPTAVGRANPSSPKKVKADVLEDDADAMILKWPHPSPWKKNQAESAQSESPNQATARSEEKDGEDFDINDKSHDSVASVDERPNNVLSSSATKAIRRLTTTKFARGRCQLTVLKSGQMLSMAQPFILGLTVLALRSLSRAVKIPHTGSKPELVNRLIYKLAINQEMPFSQLPAYVQKYDSTNAQQTRLSKSIIRDLTVFELKSFCQQAKLPSTGNRPDLINRLFRRFAIDPEMLRLAFETV